MTTVLQLYGNYAVILAFTTALLALLNSEFVLRLVKLSPRQLLNLVQLGLGTSVLAPFIVKWGPSPPLMISSGRHFSEWSDFITLTRPLTIAQLVAAAPNRFAGWESWLLLCLLAGCLYEAWRYWQAWRRLHALIITALPLRQLGRLRLLTSDQTRVPFAFHNFKTAYVVIPESFCGDRELFTLSVRHELQHHRQHDTLWTHVWQGVQVLYFWHPGIRLLIQRLTELQEHACDEALLGQAAVSAHAYSRCLLEAAQYAIGTQRPLIGTMSMSSSSSAQKLTRRINVMFAAKVKYSRTTFGVVAALFIGLITTLALATQRLANPEPITMRDVQEVINQTPTSFPLEVNPEILAELNVYVGTEAGQKFVRASLERREEYAKILAKHLTSQVPKELEAVALVETGFQNLPENRTHPHSAGLWQFIPQTARNFGLKVDGTTDQRLNEERATDAAARLLGSLHLRFQDWRLAIMAYNAGESRVQAGIEQTGSRSPWVLIRAGFGGDPGYLAKVMAGVLLMKNPEWVSER